jgi:ABC-type sugar transport system ATPase subunit
MKQRVGYASPELSFVVWGRVEKAIRFVRGFRPTWDEAYAARLMETFSLSPGDKIATLSFGAKTKLALLLAMAWHPQVLVLDEPTTGLDAHSKRAVFAELLAIVRDEARTVVISSHQLTDLERFADRVGGAAPGASCGGRRDGRAWSSGTYSQSSRLMATRCSSSAACMFRSTKAHTGGWCSIPRDLRWRVSQEPARAISTHNRSPWRSSFSSSLSNAP